MPKTEAEKTLTQALRAASKRIPFTTRKQQNAMLEMCADDLADAYRIGAEEAQAEIVARLRELAAQESAG